MQRLNFANIKLSSYMGKIASTVAVEIVMNSTEKKQGFPDPGCANSHCEGADSDPKFQEQKQKDFKVHSVKNYLET